MIYLNLIPSNLWFINLRNIITKKEWNLLSNTVRDLSNWTCICCKRDLKVLKNKKYFHAHEYWLFDAKKTIFELSCIVCVCYQCHQVIHFGKSSNLQNQQKLIKWLSYVNKWTIDECNIYIEKCFEDWAYNSSLNWRFNLNSLNNWLTDNQILKCKNFLNSKNIKYI